MGARKQDSKCASGAAVIFRAGQGFQGAQRVTFHGFEDIMAGIIIGQGVSLWRILHIAAWTSLAKMYG